LMGTTHFDNQLNATPTRQEQELT